MSSTMIPVFRHAHLRSWPARIVKGRVLTPLPARYTPLYAALSNRYPTDAHFAAYECRDVPFRLRYEALEAISGHTMAPRMQLAVFDVDGPNHRATDEWWEGEYGKVLGLNPKPISYRTRGGYRLLWELATPLPITSRQDAQAWTRDYCTWVAYLARCHNIQADAGCRDWTRLFRLPHATRDEGGQPEWYPVSPGPIGTWRPTILYEDVVAGAAMLPPPRVIQLRPRWSGGNGMFFEMLKARGHIGDELCRGKWDIRCPLEAEHTFSSGKGETVLWTGGGPVGVIHCFHSGCGHDRMTVKEWLNRGFGPEEVAEARRNIGG